MAAIRMKTCTTGGEHGNCNSLEVDEVTTAYGHPSAEKLIKIAVSIGKKKYEKYAVPVIYRCATCL